MPLCRRHPRAAALVLQAAGAVVAGSALETVGGVGLLGCSGRWKFGSDGARRGPAWESERDRFGTGGTVAVARPSCAVLLERGPAPSSFAAGFSASALPFAKVFL